ncbi:DUF2384 domain-containing protein [Actinopolymorpha alba]|uniref:DUF2384 domain-containing protein n=1 Tax=Actinopolymorpha alba TaxID=533267 RepID=UPI000364FD5B|nr:DUF2384 domain-containing protein [Actinopolymorpha alba]
MGRHDPLLARVPPDLAGHARAVVDWLVGDVMEFTELGLADVRRMLWIDLPNRWAVPEPQWPQVVEAGAQVFDLAGRPSLAALARSDETREILAAYARSREEGVLAANAAFDRTGTKPPDTDVLTWGRIMGGAEANAYDELQRVLEAAVIAGEYIPGTRGWQQRQKALAVRWLTSPSHYFDGWRPVDVIHTVRREEWVDTGTPARTVILGDVAPLLREPVPAPEGEPAPLDWFLRRIGTSIRLTERGYLPPDMVREGDERFEWSAPPYLASREVNLPPLTKLREVARQHKLVIKRKDELRLSPLGRTVVADPARMWEVGAVAWLGEHIFDIRVSELAAALLFREPKKAETIAATIHDAVAPDFRVKGGGQVSLSATTEAVWDWIRRGLALGLIDDRWRGPEYALTEVGRKAALTAWQARAHGPQH